MLTVQRALESSGYPLADPKDYAWTISTKHERGSSAVCVQITDTYNLEGIAFGLFEILAQVARRDTVAAEQILELANDMWETLKQGRRFEAEATA